MLYIMSCFLCRRYIHGEYLQLQLLLFADCEHAQTQIIDKAKIAGSDEDALALTGTVTTRLRHPCIVRVLAHCVTDGLIGTKPWDSALSQQGARYDNACWMLLEYCDKGTLIVRPYPGPHSCHAESIHASRTHRTDSLSETPQFQHAD